MKTTLDESKVLDNRFQTLFWNAFQLRCPVCKSGLIFHGWFGVREKCTDCQSPVEREEGFFLGSIYFNYGMTCTIALIVFVVGFFLLDIPPWYLYPPLTLFAILFPLWFLRYARASWAVFDQFFQPRVPPDWPAKGTPKSL